MANVGGKSGRADRRREDRWKERSAKKEGFVPVTWTFPVLPSVWPSGGQDASKALREERAVEAKKQAEEFELKLKQEREERARELKRQNLIEKYRIGDALMTLEQVEAYVAMICADQVNFLTELAAI